MITKELALTLRPGTELWHSHEENADGTPARARVNGQCQTWKRDPTRWRLPMKHGLRGTFQIGNPYGVSTRIAAQFWSLPDRWPIERHWTEPR